MSVCCFTGHRELPSQYVGVIYQRLLYQIARLIDAGVTEFRAGGALGFDTLAALAVLEQREEHPHIRLVLKLPCGDQAKSWKESDVTRYEYIKQAADTVDILAEHYHRGCMHNRNRALVNGSDYCICYQTHAGGGTGMTVEFANKKGLTIINVGEE